MEAAPGLRRCSTTGHPDARVAGCCGVDDHLRMFRVAVRSELRPEMPSSLDTRQEHKIVVEAGGEIEAYCKPATAPECIMQNLRDDQLA